MKIVYIITNRQASPLNDYREAFDRGRE